MQFGFQPPESFTHIDGRQFNRGDQAETAAKHAENREPFHDFGLFFPENVGRSDANKMAVRRPPPKHTVMALRLRVLCSKAEPGLLPSAGCALLGPGTRLEQSDSA